ncbi:unnamed protein product, partial [Chrysoparadoxa australica]
AALPEDEQGKRNLALECKNRAKSMFVGKNYLQAELLYTKSIECGGDADGLAPLYGNRSAARLLMNKATPALEDAQQAIATDPTYAKGYFRQGQAYMRLENPGRALASFEEGEKLEPQSKVWPAQIKMAKEAAAKQYAAGKKPPETAGIKTAPKPAPKPAPAAAQPEPKAENNGSKGTASEDVTNI